MYPQGLEVRTQWMRGLVGRGGRKCYSNDQALIVHSGHWTLYPLNWLAFTVISMLALSRQGNAPKINQTSKERSTGNFCLYCRAGQDRACKPGNLYQSKPKVKTYSFWIIRDKILSDQVPRAPQKTERWGEAGSIEHFIEKLTVVLGYFKIPLAVM